MFKNDYLVCSLIGFLVHIFFCFGEREDMSSLDNIFTLSTSIIAFHVCIIAFNCFITIVLEGSKSR